MTSVSSFLRPPPARTRVPHQYVCALGTLLQNPVPRMDVASHNPMAVGSSVCSVPMPESLYHLWLTVSANSRKFIPATMSLVSIFSPGAFLRFTITVLSQQLSAYARILSVIQEHSCLFINDAKCEIQLTIETNNINISTRPPNYR